MTDAAARLAALKERYEEKLARRVAELADIAGRHGAGAMSAEDAAAARFAAHDVAGSGALFGHAEEGRRAAAVETAVLNAVDAERGLTQDETRAFRETVAALEGAWRAGLSQ